VSGTSGSGIGVYGASTSGWGAAFYSTDTSAANGALYTAVSNVGSWAAYFDGSVDVGGDIGGALYIRGTCYTPTGGCPSDARLKKNIEPLQHSLADIMKLRPVTFEWKETNSHSPSGVQIGLTLLPVSDRCA
jgi:hypothetical protein